MDKIVSTCPPSDYLLALADLSVCSDAVSRLLIPCFSFIFCPGTNPRASMSPSDTSIRVSLLVRSLDISISMDVSVSPTEGPHVCTKSKMKTSLGQTYMYK